MPEMQNILPREIRLVPPRRRRDLYVKHQGALRYDGPTLEMIVLR